MVTEKDCRWIIDLAPNAEKKISATDIVEIFFHQPEKNFVGDTNKSRKRV
jgi:hypothetical protein